MTTPGNRRPPAIVLAGAVLLLGAAACSGEADDDGVEEGVEQGVEEVQTTDEQVVEACSSADWSTTGSVLYEFRQEGELDATVSNQPGNWVSATVALGETEIFADGRWLGSVTGGGGVSEEGCPPSPLG